MNGLKNNMRSDYRNRRGSNLKVQISTKNDVTQELWNEVRMNIMEEWIECHNRRVAREERRALKLEDIEALQIKVEEFLLILYVQ